ncbi:MAG: hypothetical protein QXI60_09085 [Thermofilaceae archaeon]
MGKKKIEAYICAKCGSMKWVAYADGYIGEFEVTRDGNVKYSEEFCKYELECGVCNDSSLIYIKGSRWELRDLVRLRPEDRILKVLEMIVDGRIRVSLSPRELLEIIEECQFERGEEFLEKVRCLINRWIVLR